MTEARRKPLFERLKASLEAGIEFAQGKRDLRTIEYPSAPPGVTGDDVAELRRRLKVSQAVLAGLLNVSPKTVQSWEQGQRKPSHSALRVIQILEHNPDVVRRLAGVKPPTDSPASDRGEASKASATATRKRRKARLPA